jgi:NodT family efflux transporter outer membrane factor (OMF) lipoprotein
MKDFGGKWSAGRHRGRRQVGDEGRVRMRLWSAAALVAVGMAVASCAPQPSYQRPSLAVEPTWSNADPNLPASPRSFEPAGNADWWIQLKDPAINTLAEAALADNPTLEQALADIDAARAALQVNNAARVPRVALSGSTTRAQVPNPVPATAPFTLLENSETLGPALSWEVDLWGRLKQSALAAQARLDARNADAEETRLSLVAQIAADVLNLRACNFALMIRDRDIRSREIDLDLTVKRRSVGNVAPVDEATAITTLANARTARTSQQEQCTREVDALVAISGRDAATVRHLVNANLAAGLPVSNAPTTLADAPDASIPAPPPLQLTLPATVLLNHPAVISAEREAAARWSEIAVARADRLPRIDLGAALKGNWLQAFGVGAAFETWSLGATLSGPLFDGGAGAAKVTQSQALYRNAVANLRATVRAAAQNVEDALAAQASAARRKESSQQAVNAGRRVLQAKEAEWRAGAISLFELEDARRTFDTAQEDAVAAARDGALAWVDLVRASGGSPDRQAPVAQSPTVFPRKQPG